MNRRSRKIVLTGAAAALLFGAWKLGYLNPPRPAQSPTTGCDAALWNHVYHPARLHVRESCKTVEGVITKIRREADGDLHILLDVEDKSLLNEKNFSSQEGALVLEPICQKTPTQADAIEPCQGYAGPFFAVKVGERVRVTGAYVLDTEHGWMEIHPVTSMTTLP
jgi:hypothetical protein